MQKMAYNWSVLLLTTALITLVLVNCEESSVKPSYETDACPGCNIRFSRCCGGAISNYFRSSQFEKIFSNRNSLEVDAHEVGFWDYQSFITASADYQPYGFGTTYRKLLGMKELAAFLAHVATKTSCGSKVATKEPLACGLCYNKEMNSSSYYCDEQYKSTYPCTPGVAYYGRGALPIYWNYNYGEAGRALKVDLLNHPEYIEQNATLAFKVAIWRWMTPVKKHQPSAHDVFIGHWKPTKNDTLAKRVPGFGTTMNVLYGDLVCGQDDNEFMNNIISHYLYYLDLMGVGQEEAGPHELLSCSQQFHSQPTHGPGVAAPHPPGIRPRVRARRGQATDPHSIAERLRRERIAERMKALQELVPSANKTDRAAMLDEIVDYVKFLRLQVKVLSMSRLGGAGAVAQLVADVPLSSVEGEGIEGGTNQQAWDKWSNDGTEQQVAKLMEEDVGAAMQFLQSKALCIMPISLASAIFRTHQPDAPTLVKPESNTPS